MKRILFVDDEPNVIDGLRRMLRKERKEWDMEFAGSAPEALELLAAKPFDVIVTDLQMPGMSGAQLLEKVVELYPDMVRIVLSGHADEKSTTRAMRVVHQYLSKPTDAETLKTAVARAFGTKAIVSDDRVRAAVAKCDSLPSLPTLYFEITKAVASETSDSRTIAQVIAKDVAFSAKLLQLVNSSFFGLGRRISSIEQTVSLLGVLRIKALVLGENILKEFKIPEKFAEFSAHGFWKHASFVAEVARQISKAEGQTDDRPDQAFTAGLLHDVGKLILVSQFPDAYGQVIEETRGSQESLCDAERRLLNVTHAEVGAYLLGLWALPPRLVEAVSMHHDVSSFQYGGMCAVTAVHVANALSYEYGAAGCDVGRHPEVDTGYLQRIGLQARLPKWQEIARQVAESCQPELAGV